MSTITPVIRFADAHAGIDFLERAFGFRRGEIHTDDAGTVVHAELWLGDDCLMIGSDREDSAPGPPAGTGSTYVVVEDADAHHARAVAAGATVVLELVDQDYGSREYAAVDDEGNGWSFGTYRPGIPAS